MHRRILFFDSLIVLLIVFSWFASAWLLGWLALPLTRNVFALPDGGLAAGRVGALALVSLGAFWGASLRIAPLEWAPWLLVFAPLATTVGALRSAARRRDFWRWARAHRSALLFSDAIFGLAFCAFLWLRMRHPELNDLEKPMDAALLGTLGRASFLPAENPWFSGVSFTNYYYFGPLMASLPARLLATPPTLAYNIVQPLWCALFLSTLWSLCAACQKQMRDEPRLDAARDRDTSPNHVASGHANTSMSHRAAMRDSTRDDLQDSLTRVNRRLRDQSEIDRASQEREFLSPLWRGVAAMTLVALLGNFETARQMMQTGRAWPLDWWTTSRVIPDTINEYPFFTMAIGDLHAHFLALPLQTLFLCLCHALATRNATFNPPKSPHRQNGDCNATASHSVLALLAGLLLGVLAMTNTWDVPIFGALLVLCALWAIREKSRQVAPLTDTHTGLPHDATLENTTDDDASSGTKTSRDEKTSRSNIEPKRGSLPAVVLALAPLPIGLLAAWPYFSRFQSHLQGVAWQLWSPSAVSFFLLWGIFFATWTAFLWRQHQAQQAQKQRMARRLNQARAYAPHMSTHARHMSTHVARGMGILSLVLAACLDVLSLWAVIALCGASMWVLWSRASLPVDDWSWRQANPDGGEDRDASIGDALISAAQHEESRTDQKNRSLLQGETRTRHAPGRAAAKRGVVDEPWEVAPFLLMLGLMGAIALAAPMFFYIRGVFGDGRWRHQDTVFKFGLQAWLLLGIAGACPAVWWWRQARTRWKIASVLFLLPFPLLCSVCVIWARAFRDAPRDANEAVALSLDGARHLPAEDRAAIQWLRLNAREYETVLEAVGREYSEFGRVSAFSGLATPHGWPQHVAAWGAPQDEMARRQHLIRLVFAWPDDATARAALKALHVRYIFVGELERRTYAPIALARLRASLPVAYQNGATFIARVP